MHGFIEHKHLVDRGLGYLGQRFLLEDSNLSINWPAVASFVIYSSIFTVVYPITFTFSLLLDILYHVPLLLFYLISWGLKAILWPFHWLAVFEPLYIYLSFAILIGLLAGLVLYGISEVIRACLEQVSVYFGAAVPLHRSVPTTAAQTLRMVKHEPSSSANSYIHDWMDDESDRWATGTGYRYLSTDEEDEDSVTRRREGKAKGSTVLWRSPAAWELALFPLSRMEELDRDEPNYDSEEGE